MSKVRQVKGNFFNTILPKNSDFNDDDAYDYADAMEYNWNKHNPTFHSFTHLSFISAVNGVIIWLDTNTNYYRFEQFIK